MTFSLHDYQVTAQGSILTAWQRARHVLVTMPTGTGKTVVFLSLLDRLIKTDACRRGLILVDRQHLVDQPVERIEEMFPALLPGTQVEQGGRRANLEGSIFGHGCRIVVATWQSLLSNGRIRRFIDAGGFSHIAVDEAHCNLDKQIEVIGHFPDAFVVGFTATPQRSDGRSLAELYDKTPAYQLLLPEAVRKSYLVPFRAYEAGIPICLDGIRRSGDGWDADQTAELLRSANVMQVVLEKWREICEGRATLAYTASVRDARDFAEFFTQNGVPAAFVHGNTPADERDRIKANLEAGRVLVVFNCDVWVKGFDCPIVSAILIIRPTRSPSRLMQSIGRGLRLYPGKVDCIVISFAPIGEVDVVMAGDLISPELRRAIREAAGDDGTRAGVGLNQAGVAWAVDPQHVLLRAIQLLGSSALAWYATPDDQTHWTAAVNQHESLCIILPDEKRLAKARALRESGQWDARYENLFEFLSRCRLYWVKDKTVVSRGEFDEFDAAKAAADALAREIGIDKNLAQKTARWRNRPVSVGGRDENGKYRWGQVEMLARYGIDPGLAGNAGEAACLITHAKVRQVVETADRLAAKEILS